MNITMTKLVILLTMLMLVYIPSPQGLGLQWEVGASGNFESFVGSQLLLWLRLRKLSFNKFSLSPFDENSWCSVSLGQGVDLGLGLGVDFQEGLADNK